MSTRPYTWDQLRRLALARQFPSVRGRGAAAVVDCVRRIGPMQTQTARAAFLGLAARLPGVTHATITQAYESRALVRGSSIRGTVHTSTPEQHVWLGRATRVGLRALWARLLQLQKTSLGQVWAGIEEFATPSWRDRDELTGHLYAWLAQHEGRSPEQLATTVGRSLSFTHGGLVRQPLSGGWEGQGKPGYRWVGAVLAEADVPGAERLAELRASEHEVAMAAVVLLHVRSHGPASRHDIAWWSGVGLRDVDAALARLGEAIESRPGPDGRDYWDVVDGGPRPAGDVGTTLLPEFDALLCGYDPKARERFVTPDHHAALWNQQNGLLRAPLLHEGRIAGWWRIEGSGPKRRLGVTSFAGMSVPSTEDLEGALAAANAAMGWQITEVGVSR